MGDTAKISPFQLFCLLATGRLFTLLLWSPVDPQPGAILLAAVVGPVVQFGLALLLVWFFREVVWAGGHPFVTKAVLAVCWLGCMVIAALTAGSTARFLSRAFYGGSYGTLAVALLLAAAAVAAWLGLEATARMGTLLLAAALAGLALLFAGAAGQAHLAYLPAPYADLPGIGRILLYSVFTNWELLLLPLLAPHATKPMKKRAIAVWLGLCGAIQLAVVLLVMLALGHYGAGQPWPVYALARCARLALAERMDALLMGLWVLLGFLRCTVVLWLAGSLWGKLLRPSPRLRLPALHGLAACLAALLLLSGCGARQTIGQKTIATMVELDYTGGSCALRVEYRQPGGKDQPTQYGVYEAEGETLEQALAALEQRHSLTLWLESCRVATLLAPKTAGQYDHQTMAWLLEQLAQRMDLRPLTYLLVADSPTLQAAAPQDKGETSTATQLLALFDGKGGTLDSRFTLKDSLALARDPQLALLLPTLAVEDGQPSLDGFLAMEEKRQGRLTVAEAQLLPVGALAGVQGLEQLPGVRLRGVRSLWLPGQGGPTLGLYPVGSVDGRTPQAAKEQLQAACRDAAGQLLEKMQNENFPDLLGLQKMMVFSQPDLWARQNQTLTVLAETDAVKIVVKPLVSLH